MTTPKPLVAILMLPMDLDAFADIVEVIAKHFPDAVLGEPDDDGQVVIRMGVSTNTTEANETGGTA